MIQTVATVGMQVWFNGRTSAFQAEYVGSIPITCSRSKDQKCASGSVGGARPCQGRGRGFESRLALSGISSEVPRNRHF